MQKTNYLHFQSKKEMLNGLFKIFSGTCVHNPFEVIIIILSLCISLSLLSSSSMPKTQNLNYDLTTSKYETHATQENVNVSHN